MSSLYLPKVNRNITEDDLHYYFSQYGEIKSCTLTVHFYKRWSFIIFVDECSANEALKKSVHLINGKLVYIKNGEEDSFDRKSKEKEKKHKNYTIRIQNHFRLNEYSIYSYCQSFGKLLLFNYDQANVLLSFNCFENDNYFLEMRPHMINGSILRVTQYNSMFFPYSNSIFIAHIDQQISEYLLYEYFSKRYGRIVNCNIHRRDKCNSFAFIAFKYQKDLIKTLNDNLTIQQQHQIKPHLNKLWVKQLIIMN